MLAQRRRNPIARGELTTREEEILRLLASGRSNTEIATKLEISMPSVAEHKT